MKKLHLILILFVGCLTSCNIIQYVTVPVDYAPKLGFKPDTTTIVIVNKLSFDSLKIKNQRRLAVLKAGAYTSVSTVAEQLDALPGVNAINLVDSVNFTENTDSLKSLVKKYHADYVLTLDKFDGSGTVQTVYNGRYYGFSSYYNTKINVQFTLYQKGGLYKKLIGKADDQQSDEDMAMASRSRNANMFLVNQSARNAAVNALQDYLPSTIYNDRPLYTNNEKLQASVVQIKAGRFDTAYKILNPLIDGADIKLASRAAYNLAVVYEAQGDIEEALEIAKLSNKKQQNDFAKTLIAALMKE